MSIFENFVLTDIPEAMAIFHSRGNIHNMKNRKYFGLAFCRDGRITYTHNGREFVSDISNIVLLPEGQSYTLKCDRQGEFYLINFSCENTLTDTFVLFPMQNFESFYNDFKQIKELLLFPENRIKAMGMFYLMIHRIISYSGICKPLLLAIEFIEKNYDNPNLSNGILARECNISEVYFRKLFSKHLSCTPKQYISEIRLQKAKQLLSENTLKVSAIAEKCGFSSANHFWRFFKLKTGLTPTEYARQNVILKI